MRRVVVTGMGGVTALGNTWPDGHCFAVDLKTGKVKDHGAIAGYRTFETPMYAEHINRTGGRKVAYPRQVSRARRPLTERFRPASNAPK